MSLCSDISFLHFFPLLSIMYVQGMQIEKCVKRMNGYDKERRVLKC